MHAFIILGLQILGAAFVLLVLFQHVANLRKWTYHPADTLWAAANWAVDTARKIGEWLARISYTIIRMCRLGDLALAAWQIAEPMLRIALSWAEVPMGYFAFAFTLGRRAMVLWGTIVLAAAASIAYNFVRVYRPALASGAIQIGYRAYLCSRDGASVLQPVVWTAFACIIGDFLFMLFTRPDVPMPSPAVGVAPAGAPRSDSDGDLPPADAPKRRVRPISLRAN